MVTDWRLLEPKAHRFGDVVADKRRRVHEPHVAPLTRLVEEINEGRVHRAPWFDPDGGGTAARVLFLHENPGRRATSERGSGFISADNNDDTAANFFRMRDQAGLSRDQLVAWNVVPWYQPDGGRTANATRQDVAGALPWLARLIRLLPELRLVVPMGSVPAKAGCSPCSPIPAYRCCRHSRPRTVHPATSTADRSTAP